MVELRQNDPNWNPSTVDRISGYVTAVIHHFHMSMSDAGLFTNVARTCCGSQNGGVSLVVSRFDIEGYLVELRQNDPNRNPSTVDHI